jgi:hypothetical protein
VKEKFCEETPSEAEEVVDPRYTSRYTIALPCHGRGREFESRRPRHSFEKSCTKFNGSATEFPLSNGVIISK